MPAAVPVVEIAHHADARGVRGPDGEVHPVHAVDRPQLGPQPVVTLPVAALVQQVQVVVGQQVRERVRIVHRHGFLSACLGHPQQVARRSCRRRGRQRTNGLEQAGRMDAPHRLGAIGVGRVDHPSLARQGKKARTANARRPESVYLVRSQKFKRIFIPAFNQPSDLIQGH